MIHRHLLVPKLVLILILLLLVVLALSTTRDLQAAEVRHDLLVTTDALAADLGADLDGTDRVVLHVGDAESYAEGHVPGARLLPWDAIAVEAEGVPVEFPAPEDLAATLRSLGVGDDDRVVLYDAAKGVYAARAFVAFDLLGLGDRAALLDGQLAKWRAEDRPIETGAPAPAEPSSGLAIDPRPERIVSHEAMRRLVSESLEGSGDGARIVDSRSAGEYSGETPGRAIDPERGGHLPGALHRSWDEDLAAGDLPVLADADTLRECYAALGLSPSDAVVTYCRTGGRAAHTYFVLRYLGYEDVALYDGSYIQWHADPEAPVEAP